MGWEVAFLKVSTKLELKEKAVLRWSNLYVLLQRRPRTSFSIITVGVEELTPPARTQAVLPCLVRTSGDHGGQRSSGGDTARLRSEVEEPGGGYMSWDSEGANKAQGRDE